jgi:hypothetical protein
MVKTANYLTERQQNIITYVYDNNEISLDTALKFYSSTSHLGNAFRRMVSLGILKVHPSRPDSFVMTDAQRNLMDSYKTDEL